MGDWRLRLHEAGGASCLKGGKRRRTYLAIRKLSSISHGMHLYVRSSNLGPLDSTRVRFICLPHCTVGDLTQLQGMPIPRISEFYGLACQWRRFFSVFERRRFVCITRLDPFDPSAVVCRNFVLDIDLISFDQA